METLAFGEVSVFHLEPETYTRLLHLAETGPGRPGGTGYDPEDPWHALIVEPHSYGCWVHTGVVDNGDHDGLPASLLAVLRAGHASDAVWILFDADLAPTLDLPVFDHPIGPARPGPASRRRKRPRPSGSPSAGRSPPERECVAALRDGIEIGGEASGARRGDVP